jgi:hypothetical protein
MIIITYLRWYLAHENKRRDRIQAEKGVIDTGLVEDVDEDGVQRVHAVDKNQLDLTDRENLSL